MFGKYRKNAWGFKQLDQSTRTPAPEPVNALQKVERTLEDGKEMGRLHSQRMGWKVFISSWPEHCKTYLIKIVSCKPRHPQWQRIDEGTENPDTNLPGYSLREIQDIFSNLKFSLDGDKNEANENAVDGKSKLENVVLTWSKGFVRDTQLAGLIQRLHLIILLLDSSWELQESFSCP